MKRKRNIILLFLIFSLSGFFALATGKNWFGLGDADPDNELPDPKEEIRKLMEKYSNPDTSIALKADILLYDRENKDALKEKTPFSYERNKTQVAGQLGYLFTYVNDSLAVQVDTVNKIISVSTNRQEVNTSLQKGLPLEQYIADTGDFRLDATVTETKGVRKLSIESQADPRIKRSTLFYNPVDYRIQKAEIEWWKDAMFLGEKGDENRTWLTVMDYKYFPATGISISDKINEILRWQNGELLPAKAFQGYQIVMNDPIK